MNERDKAAIEGITFMRKANNLQWMLLLEIALEHAPEEAKAVLRAINQNDEIISDLLKGLAE